MATRPNRWYISLEAAKRDFLTIDPDTTSQDTRIKDLIRDVSKWLEAQCRTWWMPVTATRLFDHPGDTSRLNLDQWLLSISAFTTNNGDQAVTASEYLLRQVLNEATYNEKPYNVIVMRGDVPDLLYTDTRKQANSVAGTWGYCDDTVDTGATVLNDPLAADGTSLTVLTGKLETGQMLLIESEQVFVSSITEGDPNDTVIIERAQNGTTAAAHVATTAIGRYAPPADLVAACGMTLARMYHRGATKWTDTVGSPDGGLMFFKELLPEARMIIERYRRDFGHVLDGGNRDRWFAGRRA